MLRKLIIIDVSENCQRQSYENIHQQKISKHGMEIYSICKRRICLYRLHNHWKFRHSRQSIHNTAYAINHPSQ